MCDRHAGDLMGGSRARVYTTFSRCILEVLTLYSQGSVRTTYAARYPLQDAPSALELFPLKV
jgi:hypothetical protein